MKILLTHLAPTPFAQQVARALFEADMLSLFATTFVDQPNSIWLQYFCHLAQVFKLDLRQQLSRRSVTELPLSMVRDYPWREIACNLVGRFDKDKRLTDIVFHWGKSGFDRWVARQGLVGSDAVYGYEYGCLATFQAACQRGLARIYEIPSPEHDFMQNMIQQELDLYPELHTSYRSYTLARQAERTEWRRQEWHLADVAIANSEFTKSTYATAGLDVTKIQVVPLGAPPVCTEGINGGTTAVESMRFIWAGSFNIHKGAHYLLQAWKKLNSKNGVCIDVFGKQGLPPSLLQNLPQSINFWGAIPRSKLYEHYRRSDVLVLPSLGDGFGMVVTEAFAQGLPVIVTNRVGAANLVHHGVNGFIVPSGNAEALAEILEWCITHRQELKAMRKAALETAAAWQWSDYRRVLVQKLCDGLLAVGYKL